ncbi:MAG: hypothetical protein MJ233_04975 [Mycoplasmoidaceae bacterium]|nr:hypothetical protein [Mycoplasmoidaceae bacterium]
MNKEFKCQVTIPQGYAYTFQCIKCRNLTIDSSQYSFSVLQSTSGTTYYFTVNPKTVKGDLVFVFSEKPDVEIITNPSISSNLYDIEYFDALKGMDSEIVISFDQSIAEDVSFDALECDNEVLTEDEDFVFW